MNEDQNQQWHLPANLDVTKSEKAALLSAELRKQLAPRAVSPFARQSPQEFERTRARDRISHIYDDLRRVEAELKTSRGRNAVRELNEARIALAHRLAENLATIGGYTLAAQVEPDPEQKKEYADIVSALVLDDGYRCRCAPGKVYVKRYIWSDKHKREMPLLACTGCGLLNVSSLPADLLKQREARQTARALVGQRPPDEARKILIQSKHTTKDLIKP